MGPQVTYMFRGVTLYCLYFGGTAPTFNFHGEMGSNGVFQHENIPYSTTAFKLQLQVVWFFNGALLKNPHVAFYEIMISMGKFHLLLKTPPRLNFDHLLQFLIETEKQSSGLWRSWPYCFHSPTSANEVARILAKETRSPQTWSHRIDQH